MFALQYTEYGGPEVFRWAEAEDPHPGPNQIRVKVKAASVNPIDWKLSTGMLARGKPLEQTGRPGYDAAGVVDEVGSDVTGVEVGDEVFGLGIQTQAEL